MEVTDFISLNYLYGTRPGKSVIRYSL